MCDVCTDEGVSTSGATGNYTDVEPVSRDTFQNYTSINNTSDTSAAADEGGGYELECSIVCIANCCHQNSLAK